MTAVEPLVLVVDDDPSVRKGLTRLLALADYAVETYASAREFLAREPYPGPCCLVLDVRMPGLTGIQLQEILAATGRRMSIVFVSGHADVQTSVKAMKAGAVEFLMKPFSDDVLLNAIRQAIERSQTALGHEADIRSLRDCYASLSRREREVMTLVVTGLLNKQVGFELGISEITVKAHRGKVMRKMKADSLPALVHMVARLGLLTAAAA